MTYITYIAYLYTHLTYIIDTDMPTYIHTYMNTLVYELIAVTTLALHPDHLANRIHGV